QPRARARRPPRRTGPALRRGHDQLQRERALVPADQGEPPGSRIPVRRRDREHGRARGDAARDAAAGNAPGGDDDSGLPRHAAGRCRRQRGRGGDAVMAKKFDAKAKAKRQKIIAGVLCLVLLGALAWAVPSVLGSMNKKPPSATAVAPPPAAVPPPAGAPPA